MRLPSFGPLVVIALPIVALFGPALTTDTSFAMRDAAHFYYPLFEWTTREWGAGRVPLWNPHENCGVSVVADATSSVFYPGKLIFALPLDFALKYKLYIVLHVALAAGGAYILARRWGRSPCAATCAAAAYACGGSVVFQYCNVVFLVGAAWLPSALLTADQMLLQRNVVAALRFAAVLALMILGGDPQAAYHMLLVTLLYALILDWRHSAGDEAKSRWPLSAPFRSRLALLSLAALTAGLLAAVQILPSMEATGLSERAAFDRPRNVYEAAGTLVQARQIDPEPEETRAASVMGGLFLAAEPGSHQDRIYDFSVGPWRLIELVWPNISGRMFPINGRWMSLIPAEGRVWSPTMYMGLLPLVLAVAACIWSRAEPRCRWLAWTAVLFTAGSFGYYGLGWLLQECRLLAPPDGASAVSPAVGGIYWLAVTVLPGYVFFRYPAKLLTIAALALSQLAAIGFDQAFLQSRRGLVRALVLLASGSAGAAFLVWLFGSLVLGSIKASDATMGPFDAHAARRDILMALVHTAAVAAGCAWLLRRSTSDRLRLTRWQWLASLLTVFELAAANAWLVVTAPAEIWRQPSPAAAYVLAEHTAKAPAGLPPRVYRGNLANWRPSAFGQSSSPQRLAELARWERDTLFPKYELLSGVDLVETYSSIKLADYESLLLVAKERGPRQPDKAFLPQPTALRLLASEYLLLPSRQQPAFGERLQLSHPLEPSDAALWRMDRTMPRAWIVHDIVKLPPLRRPLSIAKVDRRSEEVLFPNLRARDFARTAVVETDADVTRDVGQTSLEPVGGGEETCHIAHYSPQRVVIAATLKRPGLVVLSEAWYPGWRASVNTGGQIQSTTIYRTNRVLRGVWLNTGEHQIEFSYRPTSVFRGAAISGLAWLGLGFFFAARGRQSRTARTNGN